MTTRWGAAPEDWTHFSETLGLTQDLLPVVSNPQATIAPDSKLKSLGKTPSRYNRDGHVTGIAKWTQEQSISTDVARWAQQPDYGICLQTRVTRAIDIDIGDPELSQAVHDFIDMLVGQLPCRSRDNSGKRLLIFQLPGDMAKRVITTATGIIEFLATGQQFIAAGTHPSGSRYEWLPDLPDVVPELSLEEFESLWSALQDEFGVVPAQQSSLATRPTLARSVDQVDDPVVDFLESRGLVRSWAPDGRVNITCPWQHEHTSDSGDTETQYLPAGLGGFEQGHFHCLHAHCMQRTDSDFDHAIGLTASEFTPIEDTPAEAAEAVAKKQRFDLEQAGDYAQGEHPGWIIKDVLPRAGVALFYGESGSGKSFAILHMVGAIARGVPWRGHRVKQGKVVYIAAEGAGGVRKRLLAYGQREGISLKDIELYIIKNPPNLLLLDDTRDLCKAIGKASVVVVDTLAQTTPGGDENAAKDMGRALAHCQRIHRVTGALVILVHHSGKDASKGARGWSGLKAAADVEFEVLRMPMGRVLRTSKQKDGEDGQKWGFDLEIVQVGADEDGDPITSCVISEATITLAGATSLVPKGVNQKALVEALDGIAEFAMVNIEVAEVIKAAVKLLPPPEAGKRDLRAQILGRSLKNMCSEADSPWVLADDGLTLDIV